MMLLAASQASESACETLEYRKEMTAEELAYLEQRAEAEIEMAQRANHVRVVQAHYELANAYLDKIHGETGQPESEARPF